MAGKGFSFQADEPLNMSYGADPVSGFTAAAILNTWSEEAIANVLFGYGGERYARRIAKRIAGVRSNTPVATTAQLVELVMSAVPAPYRRGKTHAATKTFQALRIAVNDELGSLEKGLRAAWEMLAPQGRIAVITFHSLEDRMVKKLFEAFVAEGGHMAARKPIVPSREECAHNRAARSAKLRVIIKS
jgi:16S rRNA (cytosine1402-N4)-methyltransferase